MSVDSYRAYIKNAIAEHQDMIATQGCTFLALPFWFPLYPKKLEQQVDAIRSKTLAESRSEPLRKVFRNWTGIRTEMAFQPLFPFIFEAKKLILSQLTPRGQQVSFGKDILASSLAGGLSGLPANILNVIIIRLKQYPQENSVAAVRHIWKESGPLAFIRGTGFMSFRNLGFGGVFFGVNPQLNSRLNERAALPQPYKAIAVSIASAVPSAIAATVLTMPLDNGSIRRQVGGIGINNSQSTIKMIKQVYLQHGWRGFFVGTNLRLKASIAEFTAFNVFFSLYDYFFKQKK